MNSSRGHSHKPASGRIYAIAIVQTLAALRREHFCLADQAWPMVGRRPCFQNDCSVQPTQPERCSQLLVKRAVLGDTEERTVGSKNRTHQTVSCSANYQPSAGDFLNRIVDPSSQIEICGSIGR